jgi:mRNA interferase MazF
MKVSRGDMVLIDHPFSDASGSKVRPAVVVQNDRRNALLSETIVAMVSKNVRHAGSDPTQILIDIGTPDGKASGLNLSSTVKCGKLFTVDERLVFRIIGVLRPPIMSRIDDCLKAALDLK